MLEWPRGANDDCPDQEELLLASDGELSARRNEAILAHARRCARCREHLATHRTTVNRFNDLGPDDMSAPRRLERPAGHRDAFQQRLRQEVERNQRQQQQTVVARPRFQRLHTRRWLPIAAAVPLLATAFIFSSRYTETLRADDLLKGAINEQRIGSTGRMQRVQVSLIMPTAGAPAADPTSSLFTREFGAAPAIATGRSDQERQLAERLRSLHFNLDDPLSAVNFEMWRSTRTSKRDSVEYRENRQHRAVTTTTDDGEVQRAEIVVRLHDWHAIAQTLRFRDGRELISRELATWTVDVSPVTPTFAPSAASKATTERADAKKSLEAPRASAAETTEAQLIIGLRQWRQKTFDGGAAVETFGPQLSRSVDRLRATARALVADSHRSATAAGAAAATAADGQQDARAQERYRAFRRELDEVERQLTLFLGTPTYQGNSKDVPADLERRARTIAAQADALRTTVRTLLVQDDVPIRREIEAGAVEPEALAAVRRALDALWHTVTPTP